jgi:hypothetical protein
MPAEPFTNLSPACGVDFARSGHTVRSIPMYWGSLLGGLVCRVAIPIAALAVGLTGALSAVGPAPALAQQPCWRTLLDDWADGTISGTYPIACYREAIRELPEDIRLYSSAGDDINRALAARVQDARRLAGTSSRRPSVVAPADTGSGGVSAAFALAGSLVGILLVAGATLALIRHRARRPRAGEPPA